MAHSKEERQDAHRPRLLSIAWLACILALRWEPAAFAQRLDLDTPGKPKPGAGVATLALADTLDKEAGQLGTPGAPALSRAKAAMRTTARDLLRVGESLGDDGHVQILLGRTIATRLKSLDSLLEQPAAGEPQASLDRPDLVWLTHDLSYPAETFKDVGAADRVLRNAFAPWAQNIDLLIFLRGTGWSLSELPLPLLAERAHTAGFSREAIVFFAELDSEIARGFASLPYHTTALALHLDFADSLDLLAHKPSPLAQPSVERFRIALIESARTLSNDSADTSARETARSRARTLALTAKLVAAALAADPQAAAANLVTAVGQAMLAPAFADGNAMPARLSACIRAADLCAFSDEFTDEMRLPRQFRPAQRVLLRSARQSAAQLIEILPRVLSPGGNPLDPAVVGAINAHEARLRTLLHLRTATLTVIEKTDATDPPTRADFKAACDRMLVLGQDLGRADKRELALAEVHELTRDLENMSPSFAEIITFPEPELVPEWATINTNLRGLLEIARRRWITERSGPKMPATNQSGEHLEALVECMELVSRAANADAALALARRDDPNLSTLQSLAEFELSPTAIETITTGLRDAFGPVVAEATKGDLAATMRRLDQVERSYAPALLVGVLHRTINAGAPGHAADIAVAQLVSGTPDPDRSTFADSRASMAGVCRYAEEWSAAQARNDQAAAALFKAATMSEAMSAIAKRKKARDQERLLNRIR